MLFNFSNHPQPLYVWIDRIGLYSRKWNLHVDTEREVNTSIKGKESQGGGGSQKKREILQKGEGEEYYAPRTWSEDLNPTSRTDGRLS